MLDFISESTTPFPKFFCDLKPENDNDYLLTNGSSDTFNDNFFFEFFQKESFENSLKDKIIIDSLDNISNECYEKEEDKAKNKMSIGHFLIKKRGRITKDDSSKSIKKHDKFAQDNILRKIQVHYMSFVISFSNDILKSLNYNEKFLKLNYDFKKNVNKKFVEGLKDKTIKDIICNEISNKYRKQNENTNIIIYEHIKENQVLNKILSENYLIFFKKFYYRSHKIINLREYGLDKEIVLSNHTKMYKDLLNLHKDNNYQKKLNECVIQKFLPDSIFLLQ
jgi:hypothetical protein